VNISKLLLIVTIVLATNSIQAVAQSNESRKIIDQTEYGYAQANAVTTSGPMLYVSGQVGVSDTGKNDFYSQVDRSFERLASVLEKSGARAEDVVKITLLIVDMDPEKLAYMVKKRRAFFSKGYPASTLIPVARLYADGVKFEIEAIALLPNPADSRK
jgi:enamine deaminase RidA (YjgF/YER057c/UK114 family)